MGAILLGSIIYLVIFVVAAFLISEHVAKTVNDPVIKKEYRVYF